MRISIFFSTPARRIAAVVSSIVLVACIGFFWWTAVSLRLDLGNQWIDIDQEYIDDYVSVFGANHVYYGPSRGERSAWKYTKRYSKELAAAKQELEALKKTPVACPKIDKRFDGRTRLIGAGFFTYENTPLGWLENQYHSCETSPQYSRLRALREQITCYQNCDCTGFNEENFGLVPFSGVIYLKDTPFFSATFDHYLQEEIKKANYKYKVFWLFALSGCLLFFAFGGFEPVFRRVRKISFVFFKWIKYGDVENE